MIDLVVGMQYGDEGKGSVVAMFVEQHHHSAVVRLGGCNAGHGFEHNGRHFTMHQLPCAWHGGCPLVLPSGSIIDLEVLQSELEMVRSEKGISPILWISGCAVVAGETEQAQQLALRARIGSIGSGTGAARARKLMREARLARDCPELSSFIQDERIDNLFSNEKSHILVETAQGFGLSLDYGLYPFCCSTNLSVHQCLADLGLYVSPKHFVSVYGVCRTFPVRVDGDSGFLHEETTWHELRHRYGEHIPSEVFADTYSKFRQHFLRVGGFDPVLHMKACKALSPKEVFLTFVDYICPSMVQWAGREVVLGDLPVVVRDFVLDMPFNRLVRWLGVGSGLFVKLAR